MPYMLAHTVASSGSQSMQLGTDLIDSIFELCAKLSWLDPLGLTEERTI